MQEKLENEVYLVQNKSILNACRETRDTQLTVEDLTEWEKKFGIIPEGAIVIMYSGIGQFYGNKTAYFGWPAGTEENNPKDTENLHFPGISLEAAKWIVDNR